VQSVHKSIASTPQPIDFGVTKHFRSSWALWGAICTVAFSAPWGMCNRCKNGDFNISTPQSRVKRFIRVRMAAGKQA